MEARKAAFTLAEVLITLGIIGVVAALTLPTLVANYQKQVYVNSLKKAISVTQNMFKKMQADEEASNLGATELYSNGVCHSNIDRLSNQEEWFKECGDNYGDGDVFERIIPKYLKVLKVTNAQDSNLKYISAQLTCDSAKCSFSEDGSVSTAGMEVGASGRGKMRIFYTVDNMIFFMSPYHDWDGKEMISIAVDVNGEKGPNIVGRDMFAYNIDKDGKIFTENSKSTSYLESIAFDKVSPKFVEHLMQNGWNIDY